jgi:hypothetical protein
MCWGIQRIIVVRVENISVAFWMLMMNSDEDEAVKFALQKAVELK